MRDNSNPPIPLPEKSVPIVGQPMTLITWFPTLSVICNCEAKQPLLLIGLGGLSECPACGRGFKVYGVTQLDVRQDPEPPPQFVVSVVMPRTGDDRG